MHNQYDVRVLFITRKFPPAIGGMEKVACELYRYLFKLTDVVLIKWGRSNMFLPIILPYFFLRSCWILLTKKIDVIYLQDGLLAPLGLILKIIFRKPVAITIHGLDITYKNRFYQFVVPKCVKKLDKIFCISKATKQECIGRGVLEEKIAVIPNGISDEFYIDNDRNFLRKKLEEKLGIELKNTRVLLSVGRLVERKGFHWFIENVMPEFVERRDYIVYLIVGDGPSREAIKNSIKSSRMEKRVIMLGRVDDETLKLLYNSADMLIMPNIPVEGDMEGFGVVALEAASCGTPVVASELEGIRDAIIDGKTGFLVGVYNAEEFVKVINKVLEKSKVEEFRKRIRDSTLRNYNWKKVAKRYLEILIINKLII